MITDALLDVLQTIIGAVIGLFPTYSMPSGIGFSILAAANIVFPIDVLLTWIGVSLAFMAAGMTYWGIMVIINLIRGSGA